MAEAREYKKRWTENDEMEERGEVETFTLSDAEFDMAHKVRLGEGTFGTASKVLWRKKGEYYCAKLIRGAGSVCSEEKERDLC